MKKAIFNIMYWSLTGFALIQFIPVDRTNKPVKKSENFVDIYRTPSDVRALLKTACYDCHSNETEYPGYAYVAPVSWSIKDHVNSGREHLNFSEWGTFNADLKKYMLENSIADIQQNRMPLAGYIAQHPGARLSAADQKLLIDYFSEIMKKQQN